MKVRFSIKLKTLMFISIVLIILSCSVGIFSIFEMNNLGAKLIGEKALSIVRTFSYQIDGNQFENIAKNNVVNDLYVKRINNLMHMVKSDTGCTYIYAMSKVNDGKYKYVFSDDGKVGSYEDVSSYDEAFKDSMNKGKSGYTAVQRDSEYGAVLSAVVPIKNSFGKVVGILACDFLAKSIEAKVVYIKWGIAVISIILLLALCILSYYYIGSITKSINRNVLLLSKLSEGDLNVKESEKDLKRKDEIGDIANSIINLRNYFKNIIAQVNQTATSLLTVSQELEQVSEEAAVTTEGIDKAVEEIAIGATSQAQSTQKASEQTVIMGEDINNTAKAAQELHINAGNMKQSGSIALDTLNQLNDINEKTKKKIDVIYRQTNETNDYALKIQEAANFITSVAAETNLLSLNASIEAARVGEEGRGFAVVADQIKKLAEQAGQSAKNIGNDIHTLIENSSRAVKTMDELNKIIEIQNKHLERTKNNFNTVYDGINHSTDQIEEIAEITKELNNIRISVVDITNSLSAISEEDAASTEETSAATAQLTSAISDISGEITVLRNLSEELVGAISIFKI